MNRRQFVGAGIGALVAGLGGRRRPALAETSKGSAPDLVDADLRRKLLGYLEDINAWILTLDVGSGVLKHTKDTTTSIFINGNFARVLMASHRITKSKSYIAEALRWCDTFCGLQQPAKTSTGQEGGFWGDCGPHGNIYFGDTGTATTALAIGYGFADAERKKSYLATMERYARFVTQGCARDPQGRGRDVTTSWVLSKGPAKGALGCGYYQGQLSVLPYTISTATTGGSFLSTLFSISREPEHKAVAGGATRWLLKTRKDDGEIPYTLHGKLWTTWPLDTLSYCTEAFVSSDLYLGDDALRDALHERLKPTVAWLLARQNADGSWGKLRSADQQRSPRAVSLLSWYYRRVSPDPEVAEAIRRFCRFLLDPARSKAYGVKQLVRTTGFVGLAVAEIIASESTF